MLLGSSVLPSSNVPRARLSRLLIVFADTPKNLLISSQIISPKWYVEMYDPETDTWTQKADMPTPRSTATWVVNGKIYAIGGTANKKPWRLDIGQVYDPSTDTWAKARSMNHARSGPAISVMNGKIYVMGGNGWSQIPNHPGHYLFQYGSV